MGRLLLTALALMLVLEGLLPFLAPDFWRRVLAPHTRVTEADGMRLPAKPNRLRIALDSFWNFQQIDTDRIPAPPRQ